MRVQFSFVLPWWRHVWGPLLEKAGLSVGTWEAKDYTCVNNQRYA